MIEEAQTGLSASLSGVLLAGMLAFGGCQTAHKPVTPPQTPSPTHRLLETTEPSPAPSLTPTPGSSLLPDLETTVPAQIYIDEGDRGEKLLRFSTTVNNVGEGPLELVGDKDEGARTVTATQIIEQRDGGMAERVAGNLVRSATHAHWHLERFALFELWLLEEGAESVGTVATQNKITFCLIDERPIEPAPEKVASEPEFLDCDWRNQGIPEGWSETYIASLPEQWVDISGLADGRYALRVTLDPDDLLLEEEQHNNAVVFFVDIAGEEASLVPEASP